MRLLSTLFLLVATLAAAPLHGTVRGGGIPMPGAIVTATRGKTVDSTVTAADGSYRFADLADGAWSVQVAMTGFVTAQQEVTVTTTTPALDFDLQIAAYTGPPPVASAPAAAGFRHINLKGEAAAPAPAAPDAGASDAANTTGPEANRTGGDVFAVNGSIDNGAASPFAQSAAFGNFRRKDSSLFNGGFGFTVDNSALDARSFSLTGQDTPKPAYNDLTGFLQFGGPLLIPHVFRPDNAPFFFVGYQKSANRNAVNTPGLVPTTAERGGDLSALGGPMIAPGDISPQALALLQLYPLPNLNGDPRYNYQIPLVTVQHQDSLQTRLSKTFNRGNQMAGTFNLQSSRSDSPNLFGFQDTHDTLGLNAGLTYRHSFTQRLYGTFGLQFSRLTDQLTPFFAQRQNVSGAAGIAGNDQTPANWGPPALTFSSGIAGLSDGQAQRNRNQTVAFSFSGYWNHYDHNLTFGGDVRRLQFNDFQQQNARGAFTFNGDATGNDFADFLLGMPDAASVAFGNADKYLRESTYDGFFTDDWRASSSLTLNLGMRWEYSAPITERQGRLVNLAIAPGFTAASPVLGSPDDALVQPDKRGLEPRLGLAWRPLPASSLVIHAGYGIYFDSSVYENIALQMAQQAPLSESLSVASSAANPLTLANGFLAPAGTTPDVFAIDPHFRIGYAQTWNASAQRDLPGALVMTLSYLGTKGTRGAQRSLPNTYAPGAANPCPACPAGFVYMTSNGNSTLESGTAHLQRRFHNGFSADVTYTYAHAMDDSALGGGGQGGGVVAQNWLDLDAERGRSNFDQRHLLTVKAQYSTGVGVRGGTLLGGWRGAAYKGWTITTQISAGSGLPLTPSTLAIVPGTGMTGIRPDATGAPVNAPPPGLFLNPAAYVAPAAGTWGTAGRNSINGPAEFSLNAGMQRSFDVSSRITANLRFDATNALNHVAYPSWNTILGSAQFGLPISANPMRSLQTTLRFAF